MDGFVLGLFLFAAFLGGFASGLAGFAMSFVVSGTWLHIITPIRTTALIAGHGLRTQGYGVWELCQASTSGFLHEKEKARWTSENNSSGLNHRRRSHRCMADEAVEHVWIESVRSCPSADDHR